MSASAAGIAIGVGGEALYYPYRLLQQQKQKRALWPERNNSCCQSVYGASMAELVDAKASKAFHLKGGVGSNPTARKYIALQQHSVLARTECCQNRMAARASFLAQPEAFWQQQQKRARVFFSPARSILAEARANK